MGSYLDVGTPEAKNPSSFLIKSRKHINACFFDVQLPSCLLTFSSLGSVLARVWRTLLFSFSGGSLGGLQAPFWTSFGCFWGLLGVFGVPWDLLGDPWGFLWGLFVAP